MQNPRISNIAVMLCETEYSRPIQFEQSNREHDQITVEDRHKRLRIMASLTN